MKDAFRCDSHRVNRVLSAYGGFTVFDGLGQPLTDTRWDIPTGLLCFHLSVFVCVACAAAFDTCCVYIIPCCRLLHPVCLSIGNLLKLGKALAALSRCIYPTLRGGG